MLIWDGTNWVNTPAPTKTSDLTNDGENGVDPFITEGEVTNILNGLNPDGTPDAGNPGYLKPGDNVSELNNDAGYITDQDTAADSDKLCGEDCDYYLNYQNFTNTPDLSGTGLWTEDSGNLYPTTLSNNVGIGTDSPEGNLELASTPSHGVPTLYLSQAPSVNTTSDIALTGNAAIRSEGSIRNVVNTGGFFGWLVGGDDNKAGTAGASEVMRITPAGLVGIGTSSPTSLLTLKGGGTSAGDVETNKQFRIKVGDSDNYSGTLSYGKKVGDSTYYALAIDAVTNNIASDILLAPSGGNVGIGIDTPAEKLHVNGKIRAKDYDLEILPPLSTAP